MDVLLWGLDGVVCTTVAWTTIRLINHVSIIPFRRDRTASNPHGYTRRRIKTASVRLVSKQLTVLKRDQNSYHEHQTTRLAERQTERTDERQKWATEFELTAGHTWNGVWERADPIEEGSYAQGYYAVTDHWNALTDPDRRELLSAQYPSSYRHDPRPHHERRRIARRLADEWRKAGAIDHRTFWLEEQAQQAIRNRADAEIDHQKKLRALEVKKGEKPPSKINGEDLSAIQQLKNRVSDLQKAVERERKSYKNSVLMIEQLQAKIQAERSYADEFNDVLSFGDGEVYRIGPGEPPKDEDGGTPLWVSAL